MIVWRLSYTMPSTGMNLEWFVRESEAQAARENHQREDRDWHKAMQAWKDSDMREDQPTGEASDDNYEVEPINVPTTRAELVRWLNTHCNSDNG